MSLEIHQTVSVSLCRINNHARFLGSGCDVLGQAYQDFEVDPVRRLLDGHSREVSRILPGQSEGADRL